MAMEGITVMPTAVTTGPSDVRVETPSNARRALAHPVPNVFSLGKAVPDITMIGSHILVDNPLVGVCITEEDQIVFCNMRFADIFGYACEELNGVDISVLFPAFGASVVSYDLYNQRAGGSPHVREMAGLGRGGGAIYTHQSVFEFQHEARPVAIWQVMDITEQKAAQACLQESEKRLRFLSEQVLTAQETERKRVASELHDGIGQSLSAVKLGLENAFRELYGDLPKKVLARLESAISSVRDTVEEVRRISMDLRPAMLDDLGVEPAINWLCREFQLAHPAITMIKKIDLRRTDVDGPLGLIIFRILQEALNNTAKHANADQLHVSLRATRDKIKLSVKDNGKGFFVEAVEKRRNGFGLYSMQERATMSGGGLVISSVPGAGTRMEVSWPRDRATGSGAVSASQCGRQAYEYNVQAAKVRLAW